MSGSIRTHIIFLVIAKMSILLGIVRSQMSCRTNVHERNAEWLAIYCITPIFRVEEIFAIFANWDFARNFPPAKIISTANGISRNFPPRENKILIAV